MHKRPALALAPVAAILAGVLALTPAGAAVHRWIERTLGVPGARPTLLALPSPGPILVSGPAGTWTVSAAGQVRHRGPWSEASYSPRALYFAAVSRGRLVAIDTRGVRRWAVARPQVSRPRWFAPSGYRVAYLSGSSLRVIAGDGTADRLLAPHVARIAPSWRPAHPYELAYAQPDGLVVLRDADSGKVIYSRRVHGPRVLRWSEGGQRLLVIARRTVLVLDPHGRTIARLATSARDGALSATGDELALVNAAGVSLSRLGSGPRQTRSLFAGAGLSQLAFSPDGRWLLVSWPAANQWVFIRIRGTPRIVAISHITQQLGGGRAFPVLEGWCCTASGSPG